MIYGNEIQEDEEGQPGRALHETYIKRIRQQFGLSKYQMLLITFGKGLLIGYVLAFLVHR